MKENSSKVKSSIVESSKVEPLKGKVGSPPCVSNSPGILGPLGIHAVHGILDMD